jgi:hypothetical protein
MADYGPRLVDQGYRILPLMPGAKMPGERYGKTWRRMAGWTRYADRQPTELELDYWTGWHGAGVGIPCGEVVAVDIDLLDPAVAAQVEEIAAGVLGASPVVRIGQAPKRLLVYRTDEPFRAIRAHPIEVLGLGAQFAAYTIHPGTGRPYAWPVEELVDVHVADLPTTTEAAVRRFLAEALAAIPPELRPQRLGAGPGTGGSSSIWGQRGTPEAVADALQWVRNDDLAYEDWVKIGYAIKGALGEGGKALFLGWSAQSSKDGLKENTSRTWDGLRHGRSGAGTIYQLAMAAGWRPPPGMVLNPRQDEILHHGTEVAERLLASFARKKSQQN